MTARSVFHGPYSEGMAQVPDLAQNSDQLASQGDGRKPHSPPYLQSWLDQDSVTVADEIRFAITHQVDLEKGLCMLEQHTQFKSADLNALGGAHDVLASLKRSTAGLKHFISSLAHPQVFNEMITSTSGQSRAQHVFEIPELLEIVLSFAGMESILQIMQVHKSITSVIRASSKLQRQLFLQSRSNSFFELPSLFESCPGFTAKAEPVVKSMPGSFSAATGPLYSFYGPYSNLSGPYSNVAYPTPNVSGHFSSASGPFSASFQRGPTDQKSSAGAKRSVDLCATFDSKGAGRLPRIGTTCQAIQMCQPPLTEMAYTLDCCAPPEIIGNKISAPSGITVGHLYQKTKELVEAHKLCPNALAGELDQDGYAYAKVWFFGSVDLRSDDLYNPTKPSSNGHGAGAPTTRSFHADILCGSVAASVRMQNYTDARKRYRAQGLRIPTLAEWEAGDEILSPLDQALNRYKGQLTNSIDE